MAKVDSINGETIELLRGKIDFYLLRGILPVARMWPKTPIPPYTPAQAEWMAVFTIACNTKSRINGIILEAWRSSTEGKNALWTDVFQGLILGYWKLFHIFPLVALNYSIIETELDFRIVWTVLQLYLEPDIPEEIYDIQTTLILKSELEIIHQPIVFTLLDDLGYRLVAPYISYEVEV